MITQETLVLATTAGTIGFIHTLMGPDHFLPFILLARAGKWSMLKTARLLLLCGLGHVLSSVLLGLVGIVFGVAVFKLEAIESTRGNFAAWLLIILGLTYFVWGLSKVLRRRLHAAEHEHGHSHQHLGGRMVDLRDGQKLSSGLLFAFFVLGPCEPLIPLLMYPAVRNSPVDVVAVTLVFSIVTIATMLAVVLLSLKWLTRVQLGPVEKYSHALAGFTIFLCGVAVKFLGL